MIFRRWHFSIYFISSVKNYGLVAALLVIHFLIPIALASTNRQVAIYYGFLMLPINIIGGGLEEIGWRGILQPYLEKLMSFSKATVLVAIIWSIWHLPLWFIIGTYQATISFFMFSLSVVGMAFSLALIRRRTSNMFLCILFHSFINSFATVFMLKQDFSTILTTVVEVVLALSIVAIGYKYKNSPIKGGCVMFIERILLYSVLVGTHFVSMAQYNEWLDEAFLAREEDLLLELETYSHDMNKTISTLKNYCKAKRSEWNEDVFGSMLMHFIQKSYTQEDTELSKIAIEVYNVWKRLPGTIVQKEPFIAMSCIDEPLTYGDEEQTRELFEYLFNYY